MIPPALWLIALPLGAAPIVYLFRRVGIGAIVAAGVTLFAAWLTFRLPTGLALEILGRTIELDPLSQVTLALLFTTSAILFLISSTAVPFIEGLGRRSVDVSVLSGAGRTFYPVSLALLGFLVAASLSRHLGIAAIFIEAAIISGVFIIQGTRLESTRAAQRFLVMMSLATPLILLVSSRIDVYQLSGRAPLSDEVQQTALLVGIGFALWLAVFPFHGWLTATANEASPAGTVFILTAFPGVIFLTLIHLISDAPWLINETQLATAMMLAGVITAGIGGLLTGVQRGLNGLMGYAALYDLGCALAIFGLGGAGAVTAVLVGLVVRALALTLIAAGVSAIRLQIPAEGFTQIRGLARRLPFATVGILIGGLTLAGAPLTAGLPVRWHLLQSIAAENANAPLLLALAGVGVTIGYLRGGYALLSAADGDHSSRRGRPQKTGAPQEPRRLMIIIVMLIVTCLGLGFFPALLIEAVQGWTADIVTPTGF